MFCGISPLALAGVDANTPTGGTHTITKRTSVGSRDLARGAHKLPVQAHDLRAQYESLQLAHENRFQEPLLP